MTDFTNDKKDAILVHIRNGMRPGAAAEAEGFERSELFQQLSDDEEFAEAVELAEREATEHVEEALYQAAISGNVTAGRIWLERSKPKRKAELIVMPDDSSSDAGGDDELASLNKLAAGG